MESFFFSNSTSGRKNTTNSHTCYNNTAVVSCAIFWALNLSEFGSKQNKMFIKFAHYGLAAACVSLTWVRFLINGLWNFSLLCRATVVAKQQWGVWMNKRIQLADSSPILFMTWRHLVATGGTSHLCLAGDGSGNGGNLATRLARGCCVATGN